LLKQNGNTIPVGVVDVKLFQKTAPKVNSQSTFFFTIHRVKVLKNRWL